MISSIPLRIWIPLSIALLLLIILMRVFAYPWWNRNSESCSTSVDGKGPSILEIATIAQGRQQMFSLDYVQTFKKRYSSYLPISRSDGNYIHSSKILHLRLAEASTRCKSPAINLAVCAVAMNEAPYIQEWLVYHILIGISYFYIYDNNSTDTTYNLLAPFVEAGYVTRQRIEGFDFQIRGYTDCARANREKHDWLGMWDIDEFIFLGNASCIDRVLPQYSTQSAVAVQWALFTTGNLITYDHPQIVVAQHRSRATCNGRLKAIHNTRFLRNESEICAHSVCHSENISSPVPVDVNFRPLIPTGGRNVRSRYRDAEAGICNYGYFHMNHYWSRSFEEYTLKCARGWDSKMGHPLQDLDTQESKRHVQDTEIFKMVPIVQKVLRG